MNTIAVLPEGDDAHPVAFHAITKGRKATGRTPGEALDALTSQSGAGEAGAAVILQLFRPDKHFSAEQRERLSLLMERWRAARDTGGALPPAEQAELERLVEEELQGSAQRAAQMSRELESAWEPRRDFTPRKRVESQARRWVKKLLDPETYLIIHLINVVIGLLLLMVGGFDLIGGSNDGPTGISGAIITVVAISLLVNLLLIAAGKIVRVASRRFSVSIELGEKPSDDPADGVKRKGKTRAR